MRNRNIAIDAITKIEGSAGLEVVIEDGAVKDLRFMIRDYRRFFTTAVRGKRMIAVPSFLSRICGTCSVAHLFASLMAIESSQGIEVSEQTKTLRRLAYDGLMIRDHALHLYFENALRDFFSRNLQRGEDALRMNAESIIRAYDPCMSCATNFLKIDWIRA